MVPENMLTVEQLKKCVFTQPYRKINSTTLKREQPRIDIAGMDLPIGDVVEIYKHPVLEPEDINVVNCKGLILVRVFDERAIDPRIPGSSHHLGDITNAQWLCDRAVEAKGFDIVTF